MRHAQVIEADVTWLGDRFERGVKVEVDGRGKIARVSKDGKATRRLEGRALLPGFVSAHSHAFQRGLRGLGEQFPKGAGSFWTWREAMYELVEGLTPERAYSLSKRCFEEMRATGFTCVGEFHYIRHAGEGIDFELDEAVARAAKDAGIRMRLLHTFYARGGFGQELAGGQRRFDTPDVETYWERMDALEKVIDPATQSLGAVAHSVRAAEMEDVAALHAEARRRGMVFHMHVEEQRKEIEACEKATGKRPMELLLERLEIGNEFTAVHCTHTSAAAMKKFGAAGANVCLCPMTEGNLGDGVADWASIDASGAGVCIGTDSNLRLSVFDEMRMLEYAQRLAHEKRGAAVDARGEVGARLVRIATEGGARALDLEVGSIEAGKWADFAAIDLKHASLAGWSDGTLLDAMVFGAGPEVVAATCVGGEWREERSRG